MKKYIFLLGLITSTLHAQDNPTAGERLIVVNEGTWQADNARLTYFEADHVVSNQWFRDKNGVKLGDTANDIIQVNDNLIAIAVNWSNLIQFILPDGIATATTEDIPNIRKMATDGNALYVTSYAHECQTTQGLKQFQKGFVAQIDLQTFQVVTATEVGYEPEGIAYYDGYLFVANTGGYAAQENHDYESTLSIIDTRTMQVVKQIDTGGINLFGQISQAGQYLCIPSAGDYYYTPAAAVIVDCKAALHDTTPCCTLLDVAVTYNTATSGGEFLTIGSSYSYLTSSYEFRYLTIDPAEVMRSQGTNGVYDRLPGSMQLDIQAMAMPYGIYANPYTGYLYATDAASFAQGGTLYQWSPDGQLLGQHRTYINPGHFLALPPKGQSTDIQAPAIAHKTHWLQEYDLWGRRRIGRGTQGNRHNQTNTINK